jgi:integrin alpha FG-GAP repeat containing protein 1
VIPGKCNVDSCPKKSLPYGLNYPGALVLMNTTSYDNQFKSMYATQLSQSSHMALQLPYTIFGLGATPNFVEELMVGFLTTNEHFEVKGISKEWRQIIPNSQLVINPFPRNTNF